MILTIYILWLATAFGLSFYGYYTKTDLYRFMGAGLFTVCGLIVEPNTPIFGTLQFINGTVETVVGNTTVISNTYAVFQSHVIGFYLAMLGMMSFYIIFMDRREVDK